MKEETKKDEVKELRSINYKELKPTIPRIPLPNWMIKDSFKDDDENA